MRHTMVTYTVKQGRDEENAALVRAVFEELAETRPAGLRYAVFYLPDSRQFIHLYTDEGSTSGVQGAGLVPSIRSRGGGSPRTAGHVHPARTNRRLPHIRRVVTSSIRRRTCTGPPPATRRHAHAQVRHRRTEVMRKLIESTLVSLDGVIDSPEPLVALRRGGHPAVHAGAGQLRRVRHGPRDLRVLPAIPGVRHRRPLHRPDQRDAQIRRLADRSTR